MLKFTSLLMISIVSLGQPSNKKIITINTDTCRYFNAAELRKIADKVTKAQELDTLYKISKLDILKANSEIILKDKYLTKVEKESSIKDGMITSLTTDNKQLVKDLKKSKRRHKITKICWAGTTVALTGLYIYSTITRLP